MGICRIAQFPQKHVYIFLLSFLSINAQAMNLHGTVSNSAGKPIAGAIVTLVNQGFADTTGVDGTYLMKTTSAKSNTSMPQIRNFVLKNGSLVFSLPEIIPVKVEIYSLEGKLLNREQILNAHRGFYRFNIDKNFSTNLLVIRTLIGPDEFTFCYVPSNTKYLKNQNITSTGDRLAKSVIVNDTLNVTAKNYKTKVVPINSYDQKLDITLDTINKNVIPKMTLKPGDFYFVDGGVPSFIYGRNVTGSQQSDFDMILGWAKTSGTKIIRVHLTHSFGMGITRNGEIDQAWVSKWDTVFNKAEEDGVCIIPVFGVWADWNNGTPDYGWHNWKNNPLNTLNGGPGNVPGELFQPNSMVQSLWVGWVKKLVNRWQSRSNIVGWEIFSELNIASGSSESLAVDFVKTTTAKIHEADSALRPITASLAEVEDWPALNNSSSLNFIEIHPYPYNGALDTWIISEVGQKIATYHKPVFIGESGLCANDPSSGSTITTATNASRGIRHALWAAIVSGAMNGRNLWWEDSYAVYYPSLSFTFLNNYMAMEEPSENFIKSVNCTGFCPLKVDLSAAPQIKGGVIGNDNFVIGWFRDAGCEPPDWNLQNTISGQSVSITVPGSNTKWRVDFYNTATGVDNTGTVLVNRKGSTITVPLPQFTDDIAFKMYLFN